MGSRNRHRRRHRVYDSTTSTFERSSCDDDWSEKSVCDKTSSLKRHYDGQNMSNLHSVHGARKQYRCTRPKRVYSRSPANYKERRRYKSTRPTTDVYEWRHTSLNERSERQESIQSSGKPTPLNRRDKTDRHFPSFDELRRRQRNQYSGDSSHSTPTKTEPKRRRREKQLHVRKSPACSGHYISRSRSPRSCASDYENNHSRSRSRIRTRRRFSNNRRAFRERETMFEGYNSDRAQMNDAHYNGRDSGVGLNQMARDFFMRLKQMLFLTSASAVLGQPTAPSDGYMQAPPMFHPTNPVIRNMSTSVRNRLNHENTQAPAIMDNGEPRTGSVHVQNDGHVRQSHTPLKTERNDNRMPQTTANSDRQASMSFNQDYDAIPNPNLPSASISNNYTVKEEKDGGLAPTHPWLCENPDIITILSSSESVDECITISSASNDEYLTTTEHDLSYSTTVGFNSGNVQKDDKKNSVTADDSSSEYSVSKDFNSNGKISLTALEKAVVKASLKKMSSIGKTSLSGQSSSKSSSATKARCKRKLPYSCAPRVSESSKINRGRNNPERMAATQEFRSRYDFWLARAASCRDKFSGSRVVRTSRSEHASPLHKKHLDMLNRTATSASSLCNTEKELSTNIVPGKAKPDEEGSSRSPLPIDDGTGGGIHENSKTDPKIIHRQGTCDTNYKKLRLQSTSCALVTTASSPHLTSSPVSSTASAFHYFDKTITTDSNKTVSQDTVQWRKLQPTSEELNVGNIRVVPFSMQQASSSKVMTSGENINPARYSQGQHSQGVTTGTVPYMGPSQQGCNFQDPTNLAMNAKSASCAVQFQSLNSVPDGSRAERRAQLTRLASNTPLVVQKTPVMTTSRIAPLNGADVAGDMFMTQRSATLNRSAAYGSLQQLEADLERRSQDQFGSGFSSNNSTSLDVSDYMSLLDGANYSTTLQPVKLESVEQPLKIIRLRSLQSYEPLTTHGDEAELMGCASDMYCDESLKRPSRNRLIQPPPMGIEFATQSESDQLISLGVENNQQISDFVELRRLIFGQRDNSQVLSDGLHGNRKVFDRVGNQQISSEAGHVEVVSSDLGKQQILGEVSDNQFSYGEMSDRHQISNKEGNNQQVCGEVANSRQKSDKMGQLFADTICGAQQNLSAPYSKQWPCSSMGTIPIYSVELNKSDDVLGWNNMENNSDEVETRPRRTISIQTNNNWLQQNLDSLETSTMPSGNDDCGRQATNEQISDGLESRQKCSNGVYTSQTQSDVADTLIDGTNTTELIVLNAPNQSTSTQDELHDKQTDGFDVSMPQLEKQPAIHSEATAEPVNMDSSGEGHPKLESSTCLSDKVTKPSQAVQGNIHVQRTWPWYARAIRKARQRTVILYKCHKPSCHYVSLYSKNLTRHHENCHDQSLKKTDHMNLAAQASQKFSNQINVEPNEARKSFKNMDLVSTKSHDRNATNPEKDEDQNKERNIVEAVLDNTRKFQRLSTKVLSTVEKRYTNESLPKCDIDQRQSLMEGLITAVGNGTEEKTSPKQAKMRLCLLTPPYPCARCPRTFKTMAGKKLHEYSHSGKCYKCLLCKYSGYSKENLKKHVKVVHSYTCSTECDCILCSTTETIHKNTTGGGYSNRKRYYKKPQSTSHRKVHFESSAANEVARSQTKFGGVKAKNACTKPSGGKPTKRRRSKYGRKRLKRVNVNRLPISNRQSRIEDKCICLVETSSVKGVKQEKPVYTPEKSVNIRCNSVDAYHEKQRQARKKPVNAYDRPVQPRKKRVRAHERPVQARDKPVYACQFCPKIFKTIYSKNSHELIHSENKPLKCEYCDHRTRHKSAMVLHQSLHTRNAPFVCQYCQASFYVELALKNHIGKNHGSSKQKSKIKKQKDEQEKFCVFEIRKPSVSNKVSTPRSRINKTSTLSNFTAIKQRKQYSCENCGLRTNIKTNFTKHMKIHDRNDPFRCQYCSASFTMKNTLAVHERKMHKVHQIQNQSAPPQTHDNEIQARSSQISKAETLSTAISVESKLPPKLTYTCIYCSKTFSKKSGLKSHMQMHNPKPQFQGMYNCNYASECKSDVQVNEQWTHERAESYRTKCVVFEGVTILKKSQGKSQQRPSCDQTTQLKLPEPTTCEQTLKDTAA